jgi:hypothetical protein
LSDNKLFFNGNCSRSKTNSGELYPDLERRTGFRSYRRAANCFLIES